MTTIYHITSLSAWQQALKDGIYHGDTLASQGFIHCSTRQQVAPSANKHFQGRKGLVLLHINVARLQAELRSENLEGGEQLFPHIYGPLNLEAVEKVEELEPGEDRIFRYS